MSFFGRRRRELESEAEVRYLIKQQEDALGTRQATAVPVRDFAYAWEQEQADAYAAALERQRVADEQHKARQKATADAAQVRQREWAEKRDELRDRVVELQRALVDAEARVQVAEFETAVAAAGLVPVYRARLEAAEQAYREHLAPQGYTPHAARSSF